MTRIQKLLILFASILALVIIGNIIFIDYTIFFKKELPQPLNIPTLNFLHSTVEPQPTPTEVPTKIIDSCYPRSCIDIIREATASIKSKAGQSSITQQVSTTGVKEFFVHLGSGSSTASDWADVPGVEAYIDSTKYERIKNAYFEASLHTPTGNQTAYVRLYNVTDKYVIWPSELSIEGGEAKLLVSPSMALPPGNKLYRVQMKTQLRSLTNLIQARVRIITE